MWLVVLAAVVGYGLVAVWPAYTHDPGVDIAIQGDDPEGGVANDLGAADDNDDSATGCVANTEVEIGLFGASWCAEPESGTLFGVMLLGAMGSLIYTVRAYTYWRGKSQFSLHWTWWYILRGLSGAGLAVLVYLMLRGGLLATSASASELNKFGLGAAAALSGLFANDAIDLLRRQFRALLGGEPPASPSADGDTPEPPVEGDSTAPAKP